MTDEEKKTNWLKFIFNLIILLIILFVIVSIISIIFNFSIAGVSVRERAHNIYVKNIQPAINYVKVNFTFLNPFFKGLDILFGGNVEAYTLEQKVEVREETGINIDVLKPFGLGYGNEFGVNTNLIAYKFDPNIKNVDAFLSCNIKDKIGNIFDGVIESSRITNIDGKNGITIMNYEGREKEEIPVRCVFSRDIGFDEGTLYLNLAYEFSPEINLEIFVLGNEFIDQYVDKYDLAFKELENGKYSNYKSKIPSSMKYVTDVKAIINFDYQPLAIGKEDMLFFKFEKENKENKVELKKFGLNLPDGVTLKDCGYLDDNLNLKSEYLSEFSKQLNSNGESDEFACNINVDENILGRSTGELIKVDSISAELVYDTKLEKKIDIKLEKKSDGEI